MKLQAKALAVGAVTAFAGILSPATALATGVCYAFTQPQPAFVNTVDDSPPFILRYIATSVGPLTTDPESKNFYHLKQTAYSLVGKVTALIDVNCNGANVQCPTSSAVYQTRLMTTVDGSIITGRLLTPTSWSYDSPGAHMGVNVHLLRRIPQVAGPLPVGPAVLECTSEQAATNPQSWRCNLRAELGFPIAENTFLAFAHIQPFILTRVNPTQVPACSVFQDGGLQVWQP